MRRITAAVVAATAFALISAASASDDALWLFPASHGTGTIAAWLAQGGEADDQGGANQALLLEKDVDTGDNSAAAHVVGLEGQPVRLVTLAYEYHLKGSACTATDPRWALFVRGRSGRQYAVNLGCKVAPSTAGAEPGWVRKTCSRTLVTAAVMAKGGSDAVNGVVAGLALVFDRSLGFTYVDNIHVQSRVANTWTFAGDNGGTNPPGGAVGFTPEQSALLAEPLTAAEQLTQDELFASLTPEEWAEIDAPESS